MADPGVISVPKGLRPHFEAVVKLTDEFCKLHLNDEYTQLCREMAGALARKRPSPLLQGTLRVWAAAIVYAVGSVNFIFDRSQPLHLTADEICAPFGVAKSTVGNKASAIRKLLRMGFYDPRWCLPSKLDDNPMVWMLSVDGLIVDVRLMPREIQQQALRQGLIPRLPAGRSVGG